MFLCMPLTNSDFTASNVIFICAVSSVLFTIYLQRDVYCCIYSCNRLKYTKKFSIMEKGFYPHLRLHQTAYSVPVSLSELLKENFTGEKRTIALILHHITNTQYNRTHVNNVFSELFILPFFHLMQMCIICFRNRTLIP